MNLQRKRLKWHAVLKLSQETIQFLEQDNSKGWNDLDKVKTNHHASELLKELAIELLRAEPQSTPALKIVKRA
ncbi:TPA: hypothetical protein P0E24_001589 [Vibrio campbellii]|uniref:hypothetical protein n=1 Tax=Vibrio sp. M260121 TaxID=3020897 RepID=UPI002F3F1A07|nr:hypothetical protein [Vibrio campbellii]HDM8242531.1 hypothetical protein [Vibrio campbellii]